MSIYPTSTAAHLAVVGVVVLAIGIALREPLIVAWGGGMLVAMALARAVTLVSVMRIRSAGFEMLWVGSQRVVRTRVGGTFTLEAEVRNRDTLSARYDKLRLVASPALEATVEPIAGQVHATGSVRLLVHLKALRVGYHGLYGLALEVRGAPGLFEVPLTFANPFGVEVVPRALARPLLAPHGGRANTLAMAGRAGNQRGDGTDLRELREHLPGDPFRNIAWKASAKRGLLVVKEFEREERDVVVLMLDASVELWSGPMGGAPLDRAIDLVATLAAHHFARGDLVGLRVFAGRELVRVEPDTGRAHLGKIVGALMDHTGVLAADRCGWDESDLAAQVTEHMRPLDPQALVDLRRGKLDRLVKRSQALRQNAPFDRAAPYGRSSRDARLRRYAACFGLHVPARLEPDRPRSMNVLAELCRHLASSKQRRPSVVHVIAPAPTFDEVEQLKKGLRKLRARRTAVRWTSTPLSAVVLTHIHAELVKNGGEAGVRPAELLDPALLPAMERAVLARAAVAQKRGETLLRRMGVKVVRLTRGAGLAQRAASEPNDETPGGAEGAVA